MFRMMKEVSQKVSNFYTCQFCHRDFESDEGLKIVINQQPTCSHRCFFNIIYKIVKKYDNEELLIIKSQLYGDESIDCNQILNSQQRNNLIFDNTKILTKLFLSNVKGGLSLYHQLIKSS